MLCHILLEFRPFFSYLCLSPGLPGAVRVRRVRAVEAAAAADEAAAPGQSLSWSDASRRRTCPVDIAAIGNVEAFSTISVRSQVTGTLTEVALQRRRLRQERRRALHDRPAPVQAALEQAEANLARDQALLGPGRSAAAHATRRTREYAQGRRRIAGTQLVAQRHRLEGQGEQALGRRDAGDAPSSTPTRRRIESAKAQLVAQQAAVDNAKLQLELHASSVADRRPHRQPHRQGRQPRHGQLHRARDDRAARAGLRHVLGAGRAPAEIKRAHGERQAAGRRRRRRTPARSRSKGKLDVRRQRRRRVDRHDQAQGDVRQRGSRAVAGPVRAREPAAHDAAERDGRADRKPCRPARTASSCSSSKPDSTVEQRPVTTGQAVGEDVVITTGLQPGETVVTEGQLRLEPGTRVSGRSDDGRGARRATAGRRPRRARRCGGGRRAAAGDGQAAGRAARRGRRDGGSAAVSRRARHGGGRS